VVKLVGSVEDLYQRGFLRLLGVLSSQPAMWTGDPAQLGHGLERVTLGQGWGWGNATLL